MNNAKEKEGIPLSKWTRVATPKKLGGWGLKYIYESNMELAMKILEG